MSAGSADTSAGEGGATALIHDREGNRFRMPLPGSEEAVIQYVQRDENTLDLQHTVVPAHARDEGAGSRLVELVLTYAAKHGLRIVPTCHFIADYLEKHPEHADVVA